jgi:hypothetical protein
MSGVLLAIDTSGSFCSIALRRGDGVTVERASSGEGDHFERLPDLVAETLRVGQLSACDLSAIVVGLGPGSFTGLRIGLSYAKGLATAARVPLLGVSSFERGPQSSLSRRSVRGPGRRPAGGGTHLSATSRCRGGCSPSAHRQPVDCSPAPRRQELFLSQKSQPWSLRTFVLWPPRLSKSAVWGLDTSANPG